MWCLQGPRAGGLVAHATHPAQRCATAGPALNRPRAPSRAPARRARPQGTTCVYSKKVEYLHNLVFRALETIHNKKQRERAAAAEEDGGKRSRQVRARRGRGPFAGTDCLACRLRRVHGAAFSPIACGFLLTPT